MKKFFYSLMALVLPVAMFISCEEPIGGEKGDPTPDPDPVPVMPVETPEQQKKALEQTALDFVDAVAAANFEEVAGLAEYLAQEYSEENYDYDSVEDWADDCFDALTRTFLNTETEKETYDWGYTWIMTTDYYSVVYAAADFTGKFEAKNGSWKYSEADDLSFHVKDAQGKPCVLRLTTSGKTKKVFMGRSEEEYYSSNNGYVDSTFCEMNNVYIQVPEVVTVTLQQDGEYIAKAVLKADLSSMKGDEFDLRKDKYNVTATVEFNGYAVSLENFKYAPEQGTSVAANFKKGNKTLLSAKASADLDVSNEDFYGSENNKVEINVMGSVQIKGNMSGDIVEAYEELEEAFDAESEKLFKNQVEKVNDLMNLNLYFYNSSKPSAKFELRPFVDEDYEDEWYTQPVIVFEDETSYSLEQYFNEEDFKKLIKAVERLGEDYEELFEDVADSLGS